MNRRWLVVLSDAPYYVEMARGLVRGLAACGAEASYFPLSMATDSDAKHQMLRMYADTYRPTDVIGLNCPRYKMPIADSVSYHCWVQDLFLCDLKEILNDKRTFVWMWVDAWAKAYGGQWLPPCSDLGELGIKTDFQDVDVSFIGYITRPLPKPPDLGAGVPSRDLIDWIANHVNKTRDFRSDPSHVDFLISSAENSIVTRVWAERRPWLESFVAGNIMRYVQRKTAVEAAAIACAKNGWSFSVWGKNWECYPMIAPFYRGQVSPGDNLARTMARSRINLHINGDTMVHSRTVEAASVGSFILADRPAFVHDDKKAFGRRGLYSFDGPGDAEEQIGSWLAKPKRRARACDRVMQEMGSRFTWKANAARLLSA